MSGQKLVNGGMQKVIAKAFLKMTSTLLFLQLNFHEFYFLQFHIEFSKIYT